MKPDFDIEDRLRKLAPKTTDEYQKQFSERFERALNEEAAPQSPSIFSRVVPWGLATAAVLCLAALILNSPNPSEVSPAQATVAKVVDDGGIDDEIFVPHSESEPIVLGDDGKIYRVLVHENSTKNTRPSRRLVALNSF